MTFTLGFASGVAFTFAWAFAVAWWREWRLGEYEAYGDDE